MRNIILPGDEACPGCSRDAILVPLCPCLAELWLVKVMSADGPVWGQDILHVVAQGSLFGARFRQPMLSWVILSIFLSNWISYLSTLPSIVALEAWYSTLGVVFPEFFLVSAPNLG